MMKMNRARILIADDEKAICRYISQQLEIEPTVEADIDFAHDRDWAIQMLDTQAPYDLLLLDLWMPDAHGVLDKEAGLKILKHSKHESQISQAIMITANSSSKTALEASGLGVYDYISKPIDYTHLTNVVKTALMRRSSEKSHQDSDTTVSPADKLPDYEIIGNSDVMIDVMKKVGRIAASDVDVLICGESGTGKELVARAIHKYSDRRKGPFIDVNCSAIPSELIEAELFGIGKRVATAVDQRPGKFLQARGGTIFLDEIGDLSLAMQPKLLRVLDSKEVQGVGLHPQHVDVRIIAATNRDLESAVKAGEFRSDLYYRLKLTIPLPPLCERIEDISILANHFLQKHARTLDQKRIRGFEEGVLTRFEQYRWPGNIRELEKAVEFAVVTCTDTLISPKDLPAEIFDGSNSAKMPTVDSNPLDANLRGLLDAPTIKEASQDFERIFLEHKLQQNNWNIQETARQIGIKRQSLHRKLKELGLHRT